MLLVAGRGERPEHGLYAAAEDDGTWSVRQLDEVVQLAALCAHPSLPVVYGLTGMQHGGLLAWDVSGVRAGGPAARLAELDALGDIPCDLAVSPDGGILVAANYGYETGGGGSLALWRLDERGLPIGEGTPIALEGSGSDPARQPVAHPHQVVFDGDVLLVPDLGAERIRRYDYREGLRELEPIPTPHGSGPRHIVVLPDGLLASAELSGALLRLRGTQWQVVPGSERTGPAATRSERNYPGDLKISLDGRTAYFANRGYDTIATFALGAEPVLEAEIPVPAWPQHILVREREVLVACWDGDLVVSLEGGRASPAFACPGAGWLLNAP